MVFFFKLGGGTIDVKVSSVANFLQYRCSLIGTTSKQWVGLSQHFHGNYSRQSGVILLKGNTPLRLERGFGRICETFWMFDLRPCTVIRASDWSVHNLKNLQERKNRKKMLKNSNISSNKCNDWVIVIISLFLWVLVNKKLDQKAL